MKTRTFTIIKPDAVAKGHTGKILDRISRAGLTLRAMKMVFMSRNDAVKFYAAHRDKRFFSELIEYMTSGAAIVAILEGEDAVATLRTHVGETDPAKAQKDTIRCIFGQSLTRNAIHASDCEENAFIESRQFFSDEEIMEADYQPEMCFAE